MSRRLFDKKIIEIDEDSCFENKSEILWSQERSECFSETDFFRKAVNYSSDASERTVSSCSWHNDEFDMKSTNKVKASLEAVDNALYEEKHDVSMCEDLFKECCIWSQRFPYLRLKGEQLVNSVEEGVMSYCTASMPNKSCNQCFNSSCLLVEGKRMPIHNSSQFQTRALLQSSNTNHLLPDYVEEIFEDHGQYEEYLALDDSDFCDKDFLESCESKNTTCLKDLQGRIIEKLVFLLWPKVLIFLQDIQQKNYDGDINLPPISDSSKQQISSSYLQRPQTEGQRFSFTDFPKLSDILTVSPKVLQQRKEYRSGSGLLRVARPTSEISLACRGSDIVTPRRKLGFYKSVSQAKVKTETSLSCRSPFTRIEKNEEDSDISQHFLPALEEDSLESATILQRIQLESEGSELPSPLCNRFNKLSCISLKCDGFLPPIVNRNYSTNNSKFNKKNTRSSLASAVTSNISSRANSNTSRISITNNNSVQQKFVTDHEDLSAKKKCEKIYGDPEVKAVTLFPIVTSLIPQREKYLSNEKKEGLFGTFVGKKM